MSVCTRTHFSTTDVAVDRRVDFWNSVASSTLCPMTVDPQDRSFTADLTVHSFGQVQLAYLETSAATVRACPQTSGDGDGVVFIRLQEVGSSQVAQCGREAVLQPAELGLCVSSRPYTVTFGSNRIILVKLPADIARDRVGNLEEFCARRIPARRAALFAGLVRVLAGAGMPYDEPESSSVICDVILDLFGITCGDVAGAEDLTHRQRIWRSRLSGFVADHVCDPMLSLSMVADALGTSRRHVQMVFARMGTTASSYILSRRLELAAHRLRREAYGASVTTIAFECGFKDLSYFFRSFRQRYGTTPNEYRAGVIAPVKALPPTST